MLKKTALVAAAAASTLVAMPSAAQAQRYGGYDYGRYDRNYDRSYDRYARNDVRYDRNGRAYTYDRYGNRVYVDSGYYGRNSGYYGDRTYSGRNYNDGYRRCSGTTGTIVGGVAGALLGREIGRSGGSYYRRGNSGTTGAIIGGAVGALAGRAVDKSRCR